MSNLLQICRAVANDVGTFAPTKIIGNHDDTAVALLRQATAAARRIYKRADWTILQREHTFNTEDGTAEYALPSDFARFIDGTAWDRTEFWRLRGPLNPREWQVAKSGFIETSGLQTQWRVKRAALSVVNRFVIDPTPTDTNDLVFEYVSNSWATASDGATLRTDWVADTDIPIIDADLIELDMIWRMLRHLSRGYAQERKEADREIDRAVARDGGMPVLRMTRSAWRYWYPNVPDHGIGS